MLTSSLVVAAGCLADVREQVAPEERAIIGGSPAGEHLGKLTGALLVNDATGSRFRCSGALIAPDIVLTAAHCVSRATVEKLSFSLADQLSDRAAHEAVPVQRVRAHPGFRWTAPRDEALPDVALAFLAAPLAPGFATLGSPSSDMAPGKRIVLVGYGPTLLEEPSPALVGRARNEGIAAIAVVEPSQFHIEGAVQACHGDSGGPAIVTERDGATHIVGVASRALDPAAPCAGGSIYTRVDTHAAWIAQEISHVEGSLPPT